MAGRDGVELAAPVTLGHPSGLLLCSENTRCQEGCALAWPGVRALRLAPGQGRCPSFLRLCVQGGRGEVRSPPEGGSRDGCPAGEGKVSLS